MATFINRHKLCIPISMEEGFIISNKNRKAVFFEIASGETSMNRIVKKHHLIEQAAKTATEELIEHGIITLSNNELLLTENGKKLFNKLRTSETL